MTIPTLGVSIEFKTDISWISATSCPLVNFMGVSPIFKKHICGGCPFEQTVLGINKSCFSVGSTRKSWSWGTASQLNLTTDNEGTTTLSLTVTLYTTGDFGWDCPLYVGLLMYLELSKSGFPSLVLLLSYLGSQTLVAIVCCTVRL